MKKLICLSFSFLTILAFSQEKNMLPMKPTYPVNSDLKRMQVEAFKKELSKPETTAAVTKGVSEVMIIEPSTRANDFKEAYQYLRAQKSGSKVSFKLADGDSLNNVIDIDIMKGGSLVIFKLSTTQGLRFKVVRIEDITSIDHS